MFYTNRPSYLKAIQSSQHRYDLEGKEGEVILSQHRDHAQKVLKDQRGAKKWYPPEKKEEGSPTYRDNF